MLKPPLIGAHSFPQNSVRHNLSVRKFMFEKMLCDGQSKRSRAAVWLLKDPEGLREYEKAFAILPSLAEKTINRSFVDSTLSQRSFETGMTKRQPGLRPPAAEKKDQDITEQARSFLSRYSSSDQLMVDPIYAFDKSEHEDSESTLSASEEDVRGACNIIRKRQVSSVYILKKRKSFGSSAPVRNRAVCYDITNVSSGNMPQGFPASCPRAFENYLTPPKMKRAPEQVTSPTLFQLYAHDKCPSPGFNLFSSPLTPLKGFGGLEMDSGIITPIHNGAYGSLPVTSLSPGLIPPLSNSTPQGSQPSYTCDSGINFTSDNILGSHSQSTMRRELF